MSLKNAEPLIGEILRRCADPRAWAEENQALGVGCYSSGNAPYESLFSPLRIGSLRLSNRCLIAPLRSEGTELRLDPRLRRFYLERARAGIALFTTPPVSDLSRADPQPIQHWLSLNERLHAMGSRILFQIRLDGAKPKQTAALAAAAAPGGFDGLCLYARDRDAYAEEALRLIKAQAGNACPVLLRLSLSDASAEPGAERSRPPRVMSGQLELLRALALAGADAFEIGLGGEDAPWLTDPSPLLPAGCFAEAARAAKAHLKSLGLDRPVAAFGNLAYPDLAEELLRGGRCDLISLDGAGIGDPDWLRKAREARSEDIRPIELPSQPVHPAGRVAVIGAGCRGLNYAIRAADAGCAVDLFDERGQAGGRLLLFRSADAYEKQNLLRYLLRELGKRDSIRLHLRTRADRELLKHGRYDRIVFACRPAVRDVPGIPGWGDIPCLNSEQLGEKELQACAKKRVVVLGHDAPACELALALRNEYGAKSVALVTDRQQLMAGEDASTRLWAERRLKRTGCRIFTGCHPEKLRASSFFFKNGEGKTHALRCSLIVTAAEQPAALRLYRECAAAALAGEIVLL